MQRHVMDRLWGFTLKKHYVNGKNGLAVAAPFVVHSHIAIACIRTATAGPCRKRALFSHRMSGK